MQSQLPAFNLQDEAPDTATLALTGDWTQEHPAPRFEALQRSLVGLNASHLCADGAGLGAWDSLLMAFLLQCHDDCRARNIEFATRNMPQGIEQLLAVATAVGAREASEPPATLGLSALNPMHLLRYLWGELRESLAFTGEVTLGLARLLRGKANTRFVDFRNFCFQAGPEAFAIITLTSVLVGMILGYLGAVQLQQFGAEIYVANLVVIGMLREMGVLMTAVVMAGRTGAAYAAQLGTMQTNEEIDAITTMGISPIEFLVLPRMLALICIMPLLTIYADLLGVIGGGIVAGGMGISPVQYITQGETALSFNHIAVGLLKSLIFATLIAIAGCRAGINSGRSSAAVGQAATSAVVTAIIYLIVADAAINILFQQLKI